MYLEVRYKFQAWILPKRENEELEQHKFFKKLLMIWSTWLHEGFKFSSHENLSKKWAKKVWHNLYIIKMLSVWSHSRLSLLLLNVWYVFYFNWFVFVPEQVDIYIGHNLLWGMPLAMLPELLFSVSGISISSASYPVFILSLGHWLKNQIGLAFSTS